MHSEHSSFNPTILLWCIPFLLIIVMYLIAVFSTNKKFRHWPIYRIVCFVLGIICIGSTVVGPIAEYAHTNLTAHMVGHLLLGMLGPLLLVISRPVTLLLRSLNVQHARKVTAFLKSKYIKCASYPVVAALLNIGGLWLLYTTELYDMMHDSVILSVVIHVHVFLAGYVFTTSIIYLEPMPHRTSFYLRAAVLILSMAGHSILSKWIYANPPSGVARSDAELGGMTMYYGGDMIDLIIVVILCYEAYRSSAPRMKGKSIVYKNSEPSPE
nr:cytochrome c oxidase assembly protein [Lysinibacillus timonensis]